MELSMGLAPIIVDELYNHVVQLAAEGITVVVVEQSHVPRLSFPLGHGDGERTDRPNRGGTRVELVLHLPTWEPSNPAEWV